MNYTLTFSDVLSEDMLDSLIKILSDVTGLSVSVIDYEQEEKTLAELIKEIQRHEYKNSCEASKKLVDHIFKTCAPKNRREQFMKAASSLIHMIPGLDRGQRQYYMHKYALTDMALSKPTLCYCWLVQIVTDIFRQQCAMRYIFMNQAMQYIEENRTEEIVIADLADYTGVSSGYMSRIIKRFYHISIVDYIHLRKLHLAIYYMSTSEMNITDVSNLLGYSEAGYFCKIFKKHEGMTPSTFCSQFIRKQEEIAC